MPCHHAAMIAAVHMLELLPMRVLLNALNLQVGCCCCLHHTHCMQGLLLGW